MRHYDITQWSDFVRDLVDGTTRQAMRQHLASDCARCGEMVASLERVVTDSEAERRLAPPDWVVRSVHAYFGLMSPRTERRRSLSLKLAFDSALDPAPAGIRGAAPVERQRVYYSQEYALYLQLDTTAQASETAIHGELVHRTEGPLPEVPAMLLAQSQIVDSSLTGEFGNFRLGCSRGDEMRLCLLVSDDEMLELPLECEET